MKNEQTWTFAQKYMGKVFKYTGIITFALTVIIMLFVINKLEKAVLDCGLVITGLQMVILLFSIISVECALKKNFNEDGTKKK